MIILRKTQSLEAIEFVKVEEFLLIAISLPLVVAKVDNCTPDGIGGL